MCVCAQGQVCVCVCERHCVVCNLGCCWRHKNTKRKRCCRFMINSLFLPQSRKTTVTLSQAGLTELTRVTFTEAQFICFTPSRSLFFPVIKVSRSVCVSFSSLFLCLFLINIFRVFFVFVIHRCVSMEWHEGQN